MEPRDLVLEQLHHHETCPIPFTLGFEGEVAERLDAYYGGLDWRERLTPYILRLSSIDADRKEEVDASHHRDVFGTLWRTDGRPFHHEEPGLRVPDFTDYHFPTVEEFIDPKREEAARTFCEGHQDSFLAAGFGWGLFERTWTIRGFQNVLMDVATQPDFFEGLLDRIAELHLGFIDLSVKLPVDGIMFSDDWGDQRGVIIGPERWRKMVKPRLAKLYERVHAAGKFALSHCCGNVADLLPDLIEIGLDVLESVQPEAMNPYDLKRKYGDRITFWGGLGSQSIIPFGTPQQIRAEIHRLCREMGRGGGYILTSAKGLQPETPTENAVAVVEGFTEQTHSDSA